VRLSHEYILEALAPTTEHDFHASMKSKDLRAIQRAICTRAGWSLVLYHRAEARGDEMQLIGITDTSMLRPQVFALQTTDLTTSREGAEKSNDDPVITSVSFDSAARRSGSIAMTIGAIASEKQAIDAFFQSLHREDERIAPIADRYWNARGGSYSDGGAFVFTVKGHRGAETLTCTDKFERAVAPPTGTRPFSENGVELDRDLLAWFEARVERDFSPRSTFDEMMKTSAMARLDFKTLAELCKLVVRFAATDDEARSHAISFLTLLNDRRYHCGDKKRSSVLAIVRAALDEIFDSVMPNISPPHQRVAFETRNDLIAPASLDGTLFIDARVFVPEGEDSVARLIVCA
jgi:hypothetical protein